jgi:hypothetical protein
VSRRAKLDVPTLFGSFPDDYAEIHLKLSRQLDREPMSLGHQLEAVLTFALSGRAA